jgi:hypothetical protein
MSPGRGFAFSGINATAVARRLEPVASFEASPWSPDCAAFDELASAWASVCLPLPLFLFFFLPAVSRPGPLAGFAVKTEVAGWGFEMLVGETQDSGEPKHSRGAGLVRTCH